MDKLKIPFGTISITQNAKKLVNEALDSGRVSQGKMVREFERQFANLAGAKKAVAVSSGTDADIIAMAVLYDFGAKRGDEIIVPALSFVATGNAVIHAGFKPVFVDIDRNTLNIDSTKIERVITKKTRAIMPVHLMGKPADMDAINAIAKKHKLYVIEDAAEAHGAEYKGKKVGTLGDMGAYSLYLAHIISTVEGGIVVTNNLEFADIMRSLRCHGRGCKCELCILNTTSGYCTKRFQYGKNVDIRFVFERIGYSSKMNELEAAVGLGNLGIYEQILAKRRKNLLTMIKRFEKFDDYFYTIKEEKNEKIGPHAFPIILKEKTPFSRDQFVHYLEENGIETRNLFWAMPTQCPGFKYLGYRLGQFSNAEYIGYNGLHIGVHQDITDEHIDYLVKITEQFLKKSSK
ncbi:DegT/DnrJ/EryC1/StrS family aminotransferase [Candidatus Shapirobacteria bacterium CG08_land_8_20_14_0_20_39_18]|uniref:DegT/DnrJ/EryC1/StrS family aminotransferase n=1 Tax=Candidatus Shapirobacteria bacterium CG08_land_8_20_14_0_20_39_18 TaxID=1974883 RepID=A0A2M6XC18_9BACT|nr:MAG: DegT/DnrJ/EryC1/StrS family aminotransferase [Candidatus Shapirobacteria bacterium CG08_land_8_20_14_0_20_39_18]PIY65391.1 MAG: DegT/DnrJ/EryC1/StrS family aminotransferase [Candidatus Shapirobacteria bacterium CG_4_10_14_0_8_um_filter_39_15]PJE68596.1 MAG: DegT/DnrJ/EryC1/StrS family aminotransferase [Candidatus Shapirobacteria bacterium CG10_big_fil_rev_8_21_14_0_10_38_8]